VTEAAPTFVCIGSIFLDDIVYPDGRTSMAVLGGGGVHCASGMLVWGERPGLIASSGQGLPEPVAERLARDFDLRGVVRLDLPQIRAWQVFEWDGLRRELMRVEQVDPFIHLPDTEQFPESYARTKAACILRFAPGFLRWRRMFPDALILWEPDQHYMIPENAREYRETLPYAPVVSPNLVEAGIIYGITDPDKLIDAMLADGATIIALRMGEEGSIVASRTERIRIPAVPVPQVVDQTGAGNAYCGGFMVGWYRTHNLKLAGCYGAVAASFTLENVGVLNPPDETERERRYNWLLQQVSLPG
jgi:cytidine kinase